ncbi:oligosaccharide flippase family protein, partial [Terribacillus saccharophilus]|uniref:oligosaccharide flippase family protein n=1 Tax=Terribacillus saccharophilus TaxID=361277 RepID=UPI0015961A6A
NYLLNMSFQVFLLIVPFITTPYVARVLGPSNLGIQAYTYSIVQVLIVIGMFGISLYGNRQIATVSNRNKEQISAEFWSIYSIQICSVLFTIFSYLLFLINAIGDMKIVFLVQGIFLIANLFDISWFLLGMQEIKQTVLRNFLVKIISIVLIFTLV